MESPSPRPASAVPQNGDLVVRLSENGTARWVIARHPGPDQLLLGSREAAIAAAREFAAEAGVDVWMQDGHGFHRLTGPRLSPGLGDSARL